ncbi:alkaline phosphatase PhoX [Methylocystis sp. Sn-Cys]|uniref:alkaline phosphatase PhoX n=1 Tax=Methylocystis sp. Sn-Cys TaxID=1701263 RepID=UPI00192444B5|nr:alkaline phosphatase PhoX [Methylocystis sp. Sn-Cys]MBL1257290.1 DUF839 domain-containing protein [Methylocystis sp. Sn-Cys]
MYLKLKYTVALAALAAATTALADSPKGVGPITFSVPNAVSPTGNPQATLVSDNFSLRLLASTPDLLENPSGDIVTFGKLATGADTVPDIHTYLVLPRNPGGPTPGYDYGRRFLYQGHENGGDMAYITRINLDVADPAHRITLLTPVDSASGKTGLNRIDGSSYNPFTQKLLFAEENDNSATLNGTGNVHEVSLDWPAQRVSLEAFIGTGGFEGIHPDGKGNIYLVEDIGGKTAPSGTTATVDGVANVPLKSARQPNSFVYRFVPNNPKRLQDGGKLQSLQVYVDGAPVTFHANDVIGDIISPAQKQLYTPGLRLPFKWVTIHESHKDDTTPFSATEAAKAAGATPFKRPENMTWLPDSHFRTFYFTATGDTDAPTGQVPQLAARGAWGAIIRVDLRENEEYEEHEEHEEHHGARASGDGSVSVFVLGDQDHAAFDNIFFANREQLLAAEDRGDKLHDQLQKYDSIWAYNVRNGRAARFVALGADTLAAPVGKDDNEPTGVVISNGSPAKGEMVGMEGSLEHARGFFTQQHGLNQVYEFYKIGR